MCLLYKRYGIAAYLLSKDYDHHDYYFQDEKIIKKNEKQN